MVTYPFFIRARRFTLVSIIAVLSFIISTPVAALTDEEVDARLRALGLAIDSPDFPEDLLEAFRKGERELHAWKTDPNFALSDSSETFDVSMSSASVEAFPFDPCMSFDPVYEMEVTTFPAFGAWLAAFPEIWADSGYDPGSYHIAPLGDGMPNLLKYVLGLRGNESMRLCVPHPVLKEHDGDTYLALRFTRPIDTEGVRYILETSTDLVNWTDGDSLLCQPRIITEPIDSNWEIVWVLDDVPVDVFPRRFLRLRLIHYGHQDDQDEMLAFRLLERILADEPGLTILDARYNGHMASAGCFRWGIEHGLYDYVIDPQSGEPVLDAQTGEPEVLWSMDEGFVLSSGWASDWNSPAQVRRTHYNSQIDSDLETWMNADSSTTEAWFSNDAVSLEIDFIPDHSNLELAFLFGSEEYYHPPNPVNDAMALFLGELDSNGNIITSTWENIGVITESLLPDPPDTTSLAVSVFNIGEVVNHTPQKLTNNLTDINGQRMFINNSEYSQHHPIPKPETFPPHKVTFSGFTRRFVGSAEGLNTESVYRLKVVIADHNDKDWDAGVFLEKNSLQSIP